MNLRATRRISGSQIRIFRIAARAVKYQRPRTRHVLVLVHNTCQIDQAMADAEAAQKTNQDRCA